jgi:pimeloyl-ACP methyl ester carboxylesterase
MPNEPHVSAYATQRSAQRTKGTLATLLLLLIVGIALVPNIKAHLQAATLLDRVGGKPVPRWLAPVADSAVTTSLVDIPAADGTPIHARLYTPANHPGAPAIVVLHGVHHLGMNEPRLMSFAQAMAACGLRVLTPELPGIADYHVSPASIATIGESAVWLAKQNPQQRVVPVGVMGLSFAGGLALLAAADPAYHSAVRFVVTIGSHDEMSRVAEYYRTGRDPEPNGMTESLPPHEYGALVLEYENLQDFVAPSDITPLHALLRAHLYEDGAAEKAARATLTPQQQDESNQLLNARSPVTLKLLAIDEQRHLDDMARISPHGHLATLTTPVYLLHGAGDNIIPAAETMWLAQELRPESLQAELISPVLSHVNLDGADPSLLDRWRLVHFFALILHAEESRTTPLHGMHL